jgi:hypothetical protein
MTYIILDIIYNIWKTTNVMQWDFISNDKTCTVSVIKAVIDCYYWSWLILFTLQCDRLYAIHFCYQLLYKYNIKLCQIKKISKQLYILYVASPVLSTHKKWSTHLHLSSLWWSSWREVTSADVCIQSGCYRSHT